MDHSYLTPATTLKHQSHLNVSSVGNEMPQSLKEKSSAVLGAGGVEELNKMIAELPDLLQRNREILDEADRLLREERESDNQVLLLPSVDLASCPDGDCYTLWRPSI